MCPAHDWNVKSQDKMEIAGFCECLTSKAFLRDTRKIVCFAILSYLLHYILTHTIYTIITHKCWGVLLREILATNLKSQRLLYPQFSTKLLVGFPQLLPLHFHTIERLIAKHLPHPLRVFSEVLVLLGSIGRSQALVDAIRHIAGSGELDTVLRSLVGVGAWRLRCIRLISLGGSLANPCIPTNFLVDQLPPGGRQRGFTPSTSISSSITHQRVFLCLHSSSLLF